MIPWPGRSRSSQAWFAHPRRTIASLALIAALLASGPVTAHPHVWILAIVTFVIEDGKLTAIRHRWMFDDFFSSYLLAEFNSKRRDTLAPEAQRELRTQAFANLRELDYFSHLRRGLDHIAFGEVSDFAASLEKGSVIYDFTLPLREPVPVGEEPVVIGVYDPSYYVEVILDDVDPARFSGVAAGACRYALRDDPASAYYFGLIVPKTIAVTCTVG